MSKKSSSIPQEFPATLGLGTLDPTSISVKAGNTTARYLLGSEVVYHVTLSQSQCAIQEFLDGQELGKTVQATLKAAFTHHLMSLPPYENRRFERLYHQITDNRNVHIEFAEDPEAIFFPAGYIFVLRQPIVASNRAKWKTLQAGLEREGDSAPLQFDGEHAGIIFRLEASGRVKTEQVMLADCTATLVNVVAAADWWWQSGIVPPEQEYRLMVLDASKALPGELRLYQGEPGRSAPVFCVFVTEDVKASLKEATRLFRESSQQVLAS
jgi:hypothetical protein